MTTAVAGVVLITGCDSGIGRQLALAFHAAGCEVWATGLNVQAMADLSRQGIHVEHLDVTQSSDLEALASVLQVAGKKVQVVVNNAGYGAMGPVIEMPLDDARRQFEVNVFGALAVAQRFAPAMIAARRGTIVTIGSTSGVMTSPFAGVYCATKAAVHALNDAMRMELAPFGIKVLRIEPNQIRTSFGDTAAAGLSARFKVDSVYAPVKADAIGRAQGSQVDNAMPADEFARKVVGEVLSPQPRLRLRLGRQLWPYTVFKPFLPSRLVDRILSRRFGLDRL